MTYSITKRKATRSCRCRRRGRVKVCFCGTVSYTIWTVTDDENGRVVGEYDTKREALAAVTP